MLVESPEEGVLTPALTNNRWGRELKRWGAAGRKPVVGDGKKLDFGQADRGDHNWRWGRCDNDGKPGEQWVLLDLSDQAVMIRSSGILVEEMVKLGRHREGKRGAPQQEHQTGDGNPAAPARML